MYRFIKTQTITQRCWHQLFSNIKCHSKTFSYEKNLKPLSSIQTRFLSIQDDQKLNECLIYSGRLAKSIKYVKIFSLSTSFITLSVQPLFLSKIWETGGTVSLIGAVIFSGLFGIVSPIVLHIITNRYALNLYHDKLRDVYIASKYTFFAKKIKIEFTPKDVAKPKAMGVMTTCIVKKHPLFFDYSDFRGLDHYRRIMGYDKPMDFGIDEIPQSINTQQIKSGNKVDV